MKLASGCPRLRTAETAFRKSDAELNKLFKDLQRQLKGEPQAEKLLVAAERAWITFRDEECAFSAASSIGGSIHPMIYSNCLQKLTSARIGDLKRFLQCDEGDTSCSLPPAAK